MLIKTGDTKHLVQTRTVMFGSWVTLGQQQQQMLNAAVFVYIDCYIKHYVLIN